MKALRNGFRPLVLATCSLLELVVSPRSLAVIFLGLAAFLTFSGWLRPPLSRDISSLHVPLGILPAQGPSAEQILEGPRRIPWDSAGALLLAAITAGTVLVLWRPRRLGLAAGVLLAAAIVANVAAALNHPALIELMDDELDQHHEIVTGLQQIDERPLATFANGRIDERVENTREQDLPLTRGFVFLRYGTWLLVLAAVGVLYGGRGPLRRRLTALAGWSAAGLAIGGILCGPRLVAEWHWDQARVAELRGNYAAARAAMGKSLSWFPELAALECTWLAQGKLDYEQGAGSSEQGPDNAGGPAPGPLALPFWQASQYARNGRTRMACGLLEQGARSTEQRRCKFPPTWSRLQARLWTMRGTDCLKRSDFGGAEQCYRQAVQVQPRRFALSFLLGIACAQSNRHEPELAEAELSPFLARCADPQLRADALNIIGDAYFDAGAVQEARNRYAESFRVFNLLTNINLHAQKGLGGL